MTADARNARQEVNFLPEWHLRQQASRRAMWRECAGTALLIVAVVGLVGQAYWTKGTLEAYLTSLHEQNRSTERHHAEIERMTEQRAALASELAVHRRLHRPISYSQISGTLAGLVPRRVTLTQLQLATEPVVTRRQEPVIDPATGATVSHRAITQTRWVVSIEAGGLAPNDVDIANFVAELGASPVFHDVKMVHSRRRIVGDLITREFKLRMQVLLNRDYVAPESDEEVARVQ